MTMRIVIATPLYPPDIAEPAPYVKTLATKLTEAGHQVTIVLYGRLPETIPGVSYICIDKRASLPLRLVRYFFALFRATKQADVIYALNGASVEVPITLLRFVRRAPILMHLGDDEANEWVAKHFWLRLIKRAALGQAAAHINTLPPERPEILPFAAYPSAAFATYEAAWDRHLTELSSTVAGVTKQAIS